jgi:hypothetical protein
MHRVRLKYEKKGPIRFASHRDLMRVFRRAFASAQVPVCFSRGFNPHPRFSFGPSLRTGWESEDEYLDAFLEIPMDETHARCAAHVPDGLRILSSAAVGEGVPKLAADVSGARYEVYLPWADVFERALGGARESVCEDLAAAIMARFGAPHDSPTGGPRSTPTGAGESDEPRALEVRCARINGGGDARVLIEYFSTMHGGKSLFPEDILTPFLGRPDDLTTPFRVVRKALYVERDGGFVSPLSRAALETKI